LNEGIKEVYPLKDRNFTAISSSSVKIDIDFLHIITSTADELSGGTNIDDLERTLTTE